MGYPSPGGCPLDAGSGDLAAALADLGGALIGIVDYRTDDLDQMTDLAERTGSLGDTDGDGEADDPLVYAWSGGSIGYTVVEGVEQVLGARTFARVDLAVSDDDPGFVVDVEPESYAGVTPGLAGTALSFSLTFHGTVPATTKPQVFPLTLTVMGDDLVLLDTETLSVVVPAASP